MHTNKGTPFHRTLYCLRHIREKCTFMNVNCKLRQMPTTYFDVTITVEYKYGRSMRVDFNGYVGLLLCPSMII